MFGRKKNEKPLLTLDSKELEQLQRSTKEMIEALDEASKVAEESLTALKDATRELNKATAELKRARQKQRASIRNTP